MNGLLGTDAASRLRTISAPSNQPETRQSSTPPPAPTTNIGQDSLVSNQLTGLLSEDSPYLQQAETQGLQQANQRGLLSSSLAVGAVENARIAAALPIAQQDASLHGQANLQDSSANQQAFLADQSFGHQQGLNDQTFGQQQQLIGQEFANTQQLSTQDFQQNQQLNEQGFGHNLTLNDQQNAQQLALQQDQFQSNQSLQAQQNQATLGQESVAQIAAIENNPNLSDEQKQTAINNILSLTSATQNVVGINAGLSNTAFVYNTPTPSTRPIDITTVKNNNSIGILQPTGTSTVR